MPWDTDHRHRKPSSRWTGDQSCTNNQTGPIRRGRSLDLATGKVRIFASGLRNPVGTAWEPTTGTLWTVVNERDGLGEQTPPDYLTSVKDGGFYGWPYC